MGWNQRKNMSIKSIEKQNQQQDIRNTTDKTQHRKLKPIYHIDFKTRGELMWS